MSPALALSHSASPSRRSRVWPPIGTRHPRATAPPQYLALHSRGTLSYRKCPDMPPPRLLQCKHGRQPPHHRPGAGKRVRALPACHVSASGPSLRDERGPLAQSGTQLHTALSAGVWLAQRAREQHHRCEGGRGCSAHESGPARHGQDGSSLAADPAPSRVHNRPFASLCPRPCVPYSIPILIPIPVPIFISISVSISITVPILGP